MLNKRKRIILVFAVSAAIIINIYLYSNWINGASSMLGIIKKVDFAYITPNTYIKLAKRLQRKPSYSNYKIKQIDAVIAVKSEAFIQAAFRKDTEKIDQLLDETAEYVESKDGSSFIRYIGSDIHVEGYMATDKKLIKTKQRWHMMEEDNTVTCSMEVYIEAVKSPQLWYLHFRKVENDWKLFMLENDI